MATMSAAHSERRDAGLTKSPVPDRALKLTTFSSPGALWDWRREPKLSSSPMRGPIQIHPPRRRRGKRALSLKAARGRRMINGRRNTHLGPKRRTVAGHHRSPRLHRTRVITPTKTGKPKAPK
jgi:hypothetical protein